MWQSFSGWLLEQEHRKQSPIFLVEWIIAFLVALSFWTLLIHQLERSIRSTLTAAALAAFYACLLVYLRVFPVTRCTRCKSLLPLIRKEISRRHIHDEEMCMEIVHGGEEYWGHYIDLYYRICSVDAVRFHCRRCNAVWEELERVPKSDFKFARTIVVKD